MIGHPNDCFRLADKPNPSTIDLMSFRRSSQALFTFSLSNHIKTVDIKGRPMANLRPTQLNLTNTLSNVGFNFIHNSDIDEPVNYRFS